MDQPSLKLWRASCRFTQIKTERSRFRSLDSARGTNEHDPETYNGHFRTNVIEADTFYVNRRSSAVQVFLFVALTNRRSPKEQGSATPPPQHAPPPPQPPP